MFEESHSEMMIARPVLKKFRVLVLSASLLFPFNIAAQGNVRERPLYGPLFALNTGTHINPEIGYGFTIGKQYYKGTSALQDKHVMIFMDLSTELQFDRVIVIAPKLSNRFAFHFGDNFEGGGLHLGLEYGVFTNFTEMEQVVRPIAGLNYLYGIIQLSYGYGFLLNNESVVRFNPHNIQLVLKPYIILQTLRRAYEGK